MVADHSHQPRAKLGVPDAPGAKPTRFREAQGVGSLFRGNDGHHADTEVECSLHLRRRHATKIRDQVEAMAKNWADKAVSREDRRTLDEFIPA